MPATRTSHTDIPLSEEDIAKVREWAYQYAGLIYMVKAVETRRGDHGNNIRSQWKYKGKYYSSRHEETLTLDWLNDNKMESEWRIATILRHPDRWFRVPILATDKQSTVAVQTNPLQSTAKQLSRKPSCIADCLIKFFDHVGLTRFSETFMKVRDYSPQWNKCASIIRKFKAFAHRNYGSIDPLRSHLTDNVLYMFQLRSVHNVTKEVDNSHAICVFNGLLYDANIDTPLPVNRPNLDKCCVGGPSWVFDRVARSTTFKHKDSSRRFIQKHLQNK